MAFQSTRPHGARLLVRVEKYHIAIGFNPRARTGRDEACLKYNRSDIVSIPRARTGRDFQDQVINKPDEVSIHAPARGATGHRTGEVCSRAVSIHAPARGATGTSKIIMYAPASFNPRARTGRDQVALFLRMIKKVSIHAPARGATCPACAALKVGKCFNPRARTGRDVHGIHDLAVGPGFNPRARTGRDSRSQWPPISPWAVSIHAPARGATQDRSGRRYHPGRFQSTRPHGARRSQPIQGRRSDGFNPRARTGRDMRWFPPMLPCPCFNPRARTGRDKSRGYVTYQIPGFNPRARTGRDVTLLGGRVTFTSFNPRARTGRDNCSSAR